MQLQVQAQGPDGQRQSLTVMVNPGTTVGVLRQKLQAQGLQLLDAKRLPEPPVPTGEVSASETTTGTTTTPHPIAEGLGAAAGGLLGTALPGGVLARLPAAGAGAVTARALAEGRLPTPVEAGKTFAKGAASQALGEGVTKAATAPARFLLGKVAPGAKAATRLMDVTGRASTAKHITAVRSFWQTHASEGPQALIKAWGKLSPAARKAAFGPYTDDLGTLVHSMTPARRSVLQGAGLLSQLPPIQALAGLDVARSTAAPFLFGQAVTRPAGARAIRGTTEFLMSAAPTVRAASRAGLAGTTAALASTAETHAR